MTDLFLARPRFLPVAVVAGSPDPGQRAHPLDRELALDRQFTLRPWGRHRINAVLDAVGYNFSLLLRWLERLLRAILQALLQATAIISVA